MAGFHSMPAITGSVGGIQPVHDWRLPQGHPGPADGWSVGGHHPPSGATRRVEISDMFTRCFVTRPGSRHMPQFESSKTAPLDESGYEGEGGAEFVWVNEQALKPLMNLPYVDAHTYVPVRRPMPEGPLYRGSDAYRAHATSLVNIVYDLACLYDDQRTYADDMLTYAAMGRSMYRLYEDGLGYLGRGTDLPCYGTTGIGTHAGLGDATLIVSTCIERLAPEMICLVNSRRIHRTWDSVQFKTIEDYKYGVPVEKRLKCYDYVCEKGAGLRTSWMIPSAPTGALDLH